MSVTAGRVFLAAVGGVLAACVVWVGIVGLGTDRYGRGDDASLAVPVAIGVVAAVLLAVAVPLVAHVVEATIEGGDDSGAGRGPAGALVIRAVLRPRRTVPVADISRVVVLSNLVLPARSGPSSVRRVVVTTRDGAVIAFTTGDPDVEQQLRRLGTAVDVDAEPLTPRKAARRYPGSAGAGERLAVLLPGVAIAGSGAVIVWALWGALKG